MKEGGKTKKGGRNEGIKEGHEGRSRRNEGREVKKRGYR